ncbi:MAG: lysoplasmalogenase [Cyclobacteriaceae bacterium]
MMKEKLTVGFYMLICTVHITAIVVGAIDLIPITKIMLMPTLIYLVFVMADGVVTMPRLMLVVVLIFSWIGDILLIYEGDSYFLGGLGSFLVAHLVYAYVMRKTAYDKPKLMIKPLIPVFIYGAVLLSILIPNAGSLAIPIVVYALCILIMISMAILRNGLTTNDSFNYVVIGAIMFVLSDSCIAIDKFVMEIPLAGFFIMTSYVSAQYLIVKGIMIHPGG